MKADASTEGMRGSLNALMRITTLLYLMALKVTNVVGMIKAGNLWCQDCNCIDSQTERTNLRHNGLGHHVSDNKALRYTLESPDTCTTSPLTRTWNRDKKHYATIWFCLSSWGRLGSGKPNTGIRSNPPENEMPGQQHTDEAPGDCISVTDHRRRTPDEILVTSANPTGPSPVLHSASRLGPPVSTYI